MDLIKILLQLLCRLYGLILSYQDQVADYCPNIPKRQQLNEAKLNVQLITVSVITILITAPLAYYMGVLYQRSEVIVAPHNVYSLPFAGLQCESDECAICLSELKLTKQLMCRHNFHKACIREWIQENPTCPICRADQRLFS